ncbi:MAG: hypothetical protein ABMB14_10560 [Myxococcota bacterium]
MTVLARGWIVASLVLAGCPKGRSAVGDPVLPEQVDPVVAQAPLAVLAAGADSLDPGPRGRALALLIEAAGADPWGRRAVVDPSDWVLRQGIDALGRRADPASRALLEQLAADPEGDPYARGLAAIRAPGPASSEAVTRALATEHEAWRIVPLALAAVRLGDAQATAALESSIATGEIPLDVAFVAELGRVTDPAVTAGLVRALEAAQDRVEDELELPVAAARLMLGDLAGEQVLRKALADDDEERRLEAVDYLVELSDPASTALLRRASADGPDLVTWYADLALAARGAGDPGVFERAAAEADREVRAFAVKFAGLAAGGTDSRRVGKTAAKVVVAGLADPDAAVRVAACRAVAALRLADGRSGAEALLADESELVRIEAAGAVVALTDR